MKGLKKCFGLLLLLFTISTLSFVVSSDVSALKHDYEGVPFLLPINYHDFVYDSDSGLYFIDWDKGGSGYDGSDFLPGTFGGFVLSGFGSSSYYSGIQFNNDMVSLHTSRINNKCNVFNYNFTELGSTSFYDFSPSYYRIAIGTTEFYDPRLTFDSSEFLCNYHLNFGSFPQPEFHFASLDNVPIYGGSDGFVHSYPSASVFVSNNLLPSWYTFDGFYTHSTAIDSDSGIHYNHSFSFSDLVNKEIHDVSTLYLPLYSYDDYWTDPTNFYAGRHLKWVGVFDFDEPVVVNQSPSSDSHFYVAIVGVDQSLESFSQLIPCALNYRSVSDIDVYQLEYTCEDYLNSDLIYMYSVLYLYSSDSNVFSTTGDWRWNTQYLVTDNDETPGSSFGGLTSGLGEAVVDSGTDNADWFQSLIHLFTFGFMNPFAPIFNLFDTGDQCVDIPTLASMIHSNETRVCPWFNSSTRNIVTPVLGFSSMMLLFGFAVRWLGGSSGNFFEDSANETIARGEAYVAEEDRSRTGWWRVKNGSGNRRINK